MSRKSIPAPASPPPETGMTTPPAADREENSGLGLVGAAEAAETVAEAATPSISSGLVMTAGCSCCCCCCCCCCPAGHSRFGFFLPPPTPGPTAKPAEDARENMPPPPAPPMADGLISTALCFLRDESDEEGDLVAAAVAADEAPAATAAP